MLQKNGKKNIKKYKTYLKPKTTLIWPCF